MTDALPNPGHSQGGESLAARVGAWMNRAGGFLGKTGFALFMAAAAIAALVAASVIGLMLAIAALFLSLAYGFRRSLRKSERERATGQTLDATQTADGWVVEPQGFSRG